MTRFILALVLAAFTTGCVGGIDPTVQCPNTDRQLTREEWRACNGYQDHDASSSGS